MTMSLHRLGAGAEAGTYYTGDNRREARPSQRDEYYACDNAGTWWSTGESIVRHGAAIDLASFRDLCAGLDPASGKALVRGAGPGHWAGIDLTFTPGKSVSVLWASGTAGQRTIIEAAHRKAVDEALQFMVEEGLVVVRSGAGGIHRHRPTDLIVGRFDHFTTREGDPNIHSHCVLANVAGAPTDARSVRYSFSHLTIDPEAVFAWQRALGAAFRASLARELADALKVRFREAGQGQWEIAGISDAVLAAFSKRSAQIEEFAGPGASSAQKEIAALATRKGKDLVPTGEALESRWHAELVALAADPWRDATAGLREPARPVARDPHDLDPPEIAGSGAVARAAAELLRHESVIERKALLQRALELAGLDGLGPEAVMAELAYLQQDGRLIMLGDDRPSLRWTTPSIAAAEAAMLRAAERPDERDWINGEALSQALRQAPHLAEEQREALQEITRRDGVAIIEAGAGTGKTTLARALVAAAQRSGLSVIGLAPSWVAADELGASTGIPAQAIARWRQDRVQDAGRVLDERSLIIVDEAGMVGTRDMEAILTAAREAGSKVVLLGDRRQLASVTGASALRAVADVVERVATLREVRRQQVDWQQAATVMMAQGDSESGLRAYADQGRVAFVSGAAAAQAQVIAQWSELRALHGDDVLMITRRNADAAELNRLAREALRREGRIGIDLVEVRAVDRSDRPVQLPLAVGDRLRFGETLPQHAIRNGHRATVEAVTARADGDVMLVLAHQDGRRLELAWSSLSRAPRFGRKATPPRIVHASAGTAHAAQGQTAAASVVYLARSTDAREIYVALSRHRHDAKIVVETDRLDALCRQRQADPRSLPTAQAIRERLFSEAVQYREKANVIDHVADRHTFVRDGAVRLPRERTDLGVSRVIQAAQRLRDAIAWLRAARSLPGWAHVPAALVRARPFRVAREGELTSRVSAHLAPTRPRRARSQESTIER